MASDCQNNACDQNHHVPKYLGDSDPHNNKSIFPQSHSFWCSLEIVQVGPISGTRPTAADIYQIFVELEWVEKCPFLLSYFQILGINLFALPNSRPVLMPLPALSAESSSVKPAPVLLGGILSSHPLYTPLLQHLPEACTIVLIASQAYLPY